MDKYLHSEPYQLSYSEKVMMMALGNFILHFSDHFSLLLFFIIILFSFFLPFSFDIRFFHLLNIIHFIFLLRCSFFDFLLASEFQKQLRIFRLEMNCQAFHFIQMLDFKHLYFS